MKTTLERNVNPASAPDSSCPVRSGGVHGTASTSDRFAARVTERYQSLVAEPLEQVLMRHRGDTYFVKHTMSPYGERPRVTTRRAWFGARRAQAEPLREVRTTAVLYACAGHLARAHQDVTTLHLPDGSPLTEQIVAARTELTRLARRVEAGAPSEESLRQAQVLTVPEHRRAVELTAEVLTLVDLYLERESVLRGLDSLSLARSAQVLENQLAAARDLLAGDVLDRALRSAAEETR